MNNTDPVTSMTLRWLRFSKRDLDVALMVMNNPDTSPHHVCWLCQQSAEKALKAALVFEGITFPYTHDLDVLKKLLPKGWAVRDAHSELFILAEQAVEARYPGAWSEPTNADAVVAESKARLVYDSVESEFKCRGVFV